MRTSSQHSYFKVTCNGVDTIVYASSASKAKELGVAVEITVSPATPEDLAWVLNNGGAIVQQPAPTGAKRGPKPGSRRATSINSADIGIAA